MSGLVLDLLASDAPQWVVAFVIVLTALVLLTGAAAKLIRAAHPGKSADAVKMQKNRIEHRQWKANRRDRRRLERAARRTERRAERRLRRSARADAETTTPPTGSGPGGTAAGTVPPGTNRPCPPAG
ncbi:hypothetical protein [Streptomyces sp. NPDC097610]|uniref:hypothetical protein n=1 Tax=Streptomyces sp. NPDC097610 TaxID=3157227 RepID=UPI0033250F43